MHQRLIGTHGDAWDTDKECMAKASKSTSTRANVAEGFEVTTFSTTARIAQKPFSDKTPGNRRLRVGELQDSMF